MRKISLNPSFFMVFSLFVLGACHGDPEQKASVCGNEVIENGEICDGDQFGQATCVSEGFAAGALACSATCEIDTAGCIPAGCGDGAALDGEHCDGADLRGKTCEDRGFLGGGTLACNADCTYNIEACELGDPEDYTSGYPCEAGGVCPPDFQNPPYLPRVCAGYIEDARLLEPFFLCQTTCERHEDCPLGKACVERDGVRVCDDEPCDTPFAACTLATGLPGLCTPVGDAMEELNLCRASELRQLGEACEPAEDMKIQFAFQFDPETSCESGVCNATGVTSSTCSETLCDALAVIEGRIPDPCPDGFNCLNLSHVSQLPESPGSEISYIRTADVGACVPQEPSSERPSGRTCHILTGLQTKGGEPCPDGGHCGMSYWTGSLQGMCGGIGTFMHVLASGGNYPRGSDGCQGTGIAKKWGFSRV